MHYLLVITYKKRNISIIYSKVMHLSIFFFLQNIHVLQNYRKLRKIHALVCISSHHHDRLAKVTTIL